MKQKAKSRVRTIIICAVLAAVGFVLDRFLGLTLPLFGVKSLSINLSYVPIFLAGFLFGPIWGALVGGVQDIISAVLVPMGPFMPGITLTTMLAGALAGFFKLLFLDKEDRKELVPKKTAVYSILTAVSALYIAGFFLPLLAFCNGDVETWLSAWEILTEPAKYKTVFCDILRAFEGTDAAELTYIGIKVENTAALISTGFVLALILTVFALIMTVRKRKAQAIVSSCAAFILTGVAAATTLLSVSKSLQGTAIPVSVSFVSYALMIAAAAALFVILLNFAGNILKIAVFCLIASTVTSVLNSFWISLAYTNVTFWVYLIPRLMSAVFISVPVYTVILNLLMNRFELKDGTIKIRTKNR